MCRLLFSLLLALVSFGTGVPGFAQDEPPEPHKESLPAIPGTAAATNAPAVSRSATAVRPQPRAATLQPARHPSAASLRDTLSRRTVAGVPVTVITFDLADPRVHVSVGVASGFPHGDESFAAMVRRVNPILAINGAYFSTTSLAPIGDVVANGQLLYQGLMGTALAITSDNRALIRRVQLDHGEDWSAYETVLGCGPALVLDGRIVVDPTLERFHDPHVMRPGPRMGIALDGSRLLIVTTQSAVTFDRWAAVMLGLHAQHAMNLDGAASLALYYRGKTYIAPSRRLTNILTISTRARS